VAVDVSIVVGSQLNFFPILVQGLKKTSIVVVGRVTSTILHFCLQIAPKRKKGM
jgi:hypothetical protein